MSEVQYELQAFFTYTMGVLERLRIPYMVVGGFAAITYGVPRLTLDVGIVVDMRWEHVEPFVQAFSSPDYYVSEEAMRDSLMRRYPFNVIESNTAAKVDLVPMPSDPFTRAAFHRRRRLEYDSEGHSAAFITPEDIVVAKLIAHRATGSDKHLRDARGVLITQGDDLNLELVRRAAGAAAVLDTFETLLLAVRHEVED
jgi:hypothetical protein